MMFGNKHSMNKTFNHMQNKNLPFFKPIHVISEQLPVQYSLHVENFKTEIFIPFRKIVFYSIILVKRRCVLHSSAVNKNMNEQKATETPFTQKAVSESDIFIHSRCTTSRLEVQHILSVHSKISFFNLNKSVTASLYLPGVQWSYTLTTHVQVHSA